MLAWRIYYANGSTFDSSQGSWIDAPAEGVVCVVVRDEHYGRVVLNGRDFYYQAEFGDELDLYVAQDIGPQLRHRCPWLKFGVGLPRGTFSAIIDTATHDADFGKPRAPHRRADDGDRKR